MRPKMLKKKKKKEYITKQSSITYIIRNTTVKDMKMYSKQISIC